MALLALCGEKHELSVERVPLSEAAHQAVLEVFANQETTFRDGEETPFDQNWLNEGNDISTAPIPESVDVFDRIRQSTDTSLPPVGDIENIRGLAMKPEGGQRILVQVFAAAQLLGRRWYVSLLYEGGTYTQLESSGFRLGDKLVCIAEDGLIKFRSLHTLGRVIDTSGIFTDATDEEVTAFANTYSNLFDIADVGDFVGSSSRNARKYMVSLASSGALQGHTAATLQEASQGTRLTITVRDGRIMMPTKSGEVTELMRFLNDGRYVGPISGEAFITNSRRRAP